MDRDMLKNTILDVAAHWSENTFSSCGLGDGPIWDTPLIGFARGDDPMFAALKQLITPTHWTPAEAWAAAYPGTVTDDSSLTVVSMAFPHVSDIMAKQRTARELPAIHWVYARNTWNAIVRHLCTALIATLEAQGISAVVPDQQAGFIMMKSEKNGLCSNWSQRHVAHIAGLGTFGLSDGFITERGMAVRLVSLVLRGVWPADTRPYKTHNEWCLYYRNGSCGACAARCPAGAITEKYGHDKDKCEAYLAFCESHFHTLPGINPAAEMGCGLCQAGVPCAGRNP